MDERMARRLVDVFAGDGPENEAEEKLSKVLMVKLHPDAACSVKGMPHFDRGSWHKSDGNGRRRSSARFGGADCYAFSYSAGDVNEINHWGMFRWDCTHFMVCLWCVDMLLVNQMTSDGIMNAYYRFAMNGLPELVDCTNSEYRWFFEDPGILLYYDERSILAGSYYLYSVLFGVEFSKKLRESVERDTDVSYFNHFLLVLLGELGEYEGDSFNEHHEWMRIGNEVTRNALAQACSLYGCVDGGESWYSCFSSSAVVALGEDLRVAAGRRAILNDLFEVMRSGRDDLNPEDRGGLSAAWPSHTSGIAASGRYLDVITGKGDRYFKKSYWADEASLLFHELAGDWLRLKGEINEKSTNEISCGA